MNARLILIVSLITGLSSCSTAYRIEQTPDDVYYSPAPPQNGYVQTNNEDEGNVYNNSSPEDREILRRINNRRLRRHYNYDNDYYYPYASSYYPYASSYYPYASTYYPYASSYYPYGSYYPVYVDPKTPASPSTYTGPRRFDLGTYTKPTVRTFTVDPRTGRMVNTPGGSATTSNGTPVRTFTKPNNGTGVGNFFRRVLSTPNTNTSVNNDNAAQSRSFEPSRNSSNNNSSSSSSSSRSSSSSSAGSAPVRTFNK